MTVSDSGSVVILVRGEICGIIDHNKVIVGCSVSVVVVFRGKMRGILCVSL